MSTSSDSAENSKNAATSAPDRRRNQRFPFSATVEAVETKSGVKLSGRTSDLAMGGCYVDTINPFPVGTEATIKIVRDKETFQAQIKVVYSMMGMGMGVAFISAQPKYVRLFQKWLADINNKATGSGDPTPGGTEIPPAERTHTLTNVVLSDLVVTLIQKNVLTEDEGKSLLRRLFR